MFFHKYPSADYLITKYYSNKMYTVGSTKRKIEKKHTIVAIKLFQPQGSFKYFFPERENETI